MGRERSRLCSWRAKAILHRSSGLSKWCRWPCCYGNIADWQQTWRGLRYLQGHSRGRSTGLFGEGSRHRAQLPQHRKGMWERDSRERERERERERDSRVVEVTRWVKSRKRRERKMWKRKKLRSEIKKRKNSREKLKAAVWCDILGGNDTGQSANMNELRKRGEISRYSLNFSFCALQRANKCRLESKPNVCTEATSKKYSMQL